MKLAEIRKQSEAELASTLAKQRQQLVEMNVNMRTKEVKAVRQLRVLKKTVARLLTVQKERQLAQTKEKQ